MFKNHTYILKKLNYYIYHNKNIKHPFAFTGFGIIIKTHHKLCSVDSFDVDPSVADETIDISDIYNIDKVI